jgi:hypothetical protein
LYRFTLPNILSNKQRAGHSVGNGPLVLPTETPSYCQDRSYTPAITFGSGRHTIKPIWQGLTNGCGTASLAMALNALAVSKGSSKKYSQDKLDYRRPFDTYASPQALVQVAREQGFYAALYNQSSFQEIKQHLDKGHLVIALYNPDPQLRFSAFHYAVIYDYEDSSSPSNRKLKLMDPGRKDPEQAKKEMSLTDFNKKWRHLKQGPISTGIDRFIIVVSNTPDLPSDRNIPQSLKVADTVSKGINWYANSYLEPIGRVLYHIAVFPVWLLWQPFKFLYNVIETFKQGFTQH